MQEYAAAKARIFQGSGVQVLNREDARVKAMAQRGREQMTFGLDAPPNAGDWGIGKGSMLAHGDAKLMPLGELPLAGLHNAANALAALALGTAVGLDEREMLAGLRGFRGLPHRLERVAEFSGVAFYDDSKGTNVGATVAALS